MYGCNLKPLGCTSACRNIDIEMECLLSVGGRLETAMSQSNHWNVELICPACPPAKDCSLWMKLFSAFVTPEVLSVQSISNMLHIKVADCGSLKCQNVQYFMIVQFIFMHIVHHIIITIIIIGNLLLSWGHKWFISLIWRLDLFFFYVPPHSAVAILYRDIFLTSNTAKVLPQ